MEYVDRGLSVAVKRNGTNCADAAAIDNERRLYDLLLLRPHENILAVYGICTDAPDGKVRLVMKYCEKGSLSEYLTGTAKHEVCCCRWLLMMVGWGFWLFAAAGGAATLLVVRVMSWVLGLFCHHSILHPCCTEGFARCIDLS
jgi:hypothetical protein